jgi:hypothetical protein
VIPLAELSSAAILSVQIAFDKETRNHYAVADAVTK